MASDNLIPQSERTKEEQRKIAKMGAKKSIEVRRKKRDTKQIIEALFESKAPEKLIAKMKELYPNADIKTIADLCHASMMRKIIQGNVNAYNAIMDRKEGKPKQSTDITTDGRPLIDNVTVIFKDFSDGDNSE